MKQKTSNITKTYPKFKAGERYAYPTLSLFRGQPVFYEVEIVSVQTLPNGRPVIVAVWDGKPARGIACEFLAPLDRYKETVTWWAQ